MSLFLRSALTCLYLCFSHIDSTNLTTSVLANQVMLASDGLFLLKDGSYFVMDEAEFHYVKSYVGKIYDIDVSCTYIAEDCDKERCLLSFKTVYSSTLYICYSFVVIKDLTHQERLVAVTYKGKTLRVSDEYIVIKSSMPKLFYSYHVSLFEKPVVDLLSLNVTVDADSYKYAYFSVRYFVGLINNSKFVTFTNFEFDYICGDSRHGAGRINIFSRAKPHRCVSLLNLCLVSYHEALCPRGIEFLPMRKFTYRQSRLDPVSRTHPRSRVVSDNVTLYKVFSNYTTKEFESLAKMVNLLSRDLLLDLRDVFQDSINITVDKYFSKFQSNLNHALKLINDKPYLIKLFPDYSSLEIDSIRNFLSLVSDNLFNSTNVLYERNVILLTTLFQKLLSNLNENSAKITRRLVDDVLITLFNTTTASSSKKHSYGNFISDAIVALFKPFFTLFKEMLTEYWLTFSPLLKEFISVILDILISLFQDVVVLLEGILVKLEAALERLFKVVNSLLNIVFSLILKLVKSIERDCLLFEYVLLAIALNHFIQSNILILILLIFVSLVIGFEREYPSFFLSFLD